MRPVTDGQCGEVDILRQLLCDLRNYIRECRLVIDREAKLALSAREAEYHGGYGVPGLRLGESGSYHERN
jgi:hypothetical protein